MGQWHGRERVRQGEGDSSKKDMMGEGQKSWEKKLNGDPRHPSKGSKSEAVDIGLTKMKQKEEEQTKEVKEKKER